MLGSASPRRAELLAALGAAFTIAAADLDEEMFGDPGADATRLAREKAQAILESHPEAVVVGADTIVHDGVRSYGKPVAEGDAVAMLESLCGVEHQVYTGVCVVSTGGCETEVSVSNVWLRSLSRAEIVGYVRGAGHMDKAGAYAIQDAAHPIVDSYDGCFCSIMGLPLWRTYAALRRLGIDVEEPAGAIGRCAGCPERKT